MDIQKLHVICPSRAHMQASEKKNAHTHTHARTYACMHARTHSRTHTCDTRYAHTHTWHMPQAGGHIRQRVLAHASMFALHIPRARTHASHVTSHHVPSLHLITPHRTAPHCTTRMRAHACRPKQKYDLAVAAIKFQGNTEEPSKLFTAGGSELGGTTGVYISSTDMESYDITTDQYS